MADAALGEPLDALDAEDRTQAIRALRVVCPDCDAEVGTFCTRIYTNPMGSWWELGHSARHVHAGREPLHPLLEAVLLARAYGRREGSS